MKRRLLLLGLLVVVLGVIALACGSGNNSVREATRQVSKVVPVVEKISSEITREPIACEPELKTPQPRGCTSGTLTCGSVIEGNNTGMPRHWGDQFYVSAFCTPQRHYYEEAGEAVYRLELPPNIQADIRLDSDCADLDVVSLSWADTSTCPGEQHTGRIRQCEMDTHSEGGTIRITTVNDPEVHILGVDGKQGASGNFRLTVTCSTYR